MSKIKLEFSFEEKDKKKKLLVRTLDTEWKQFDTAYILGEVAESLILGTYEEIYFDFSSLNFVCSSCLGSFVTLAAKAREQKKNYTFDFGEKVKRVVFKSGIQNILTHGD